MEFLALLLIGIGGILLNILTDFRDLVTKTPKNGLKFRERLALVWVKFDVLGGLAYGGFALVVVILMVGLRERLVDIFPVTELTILFVGYAADAAIKKLKPENLS